MLEKGLQFGNNGDDPARLTADIMDASGDEAWPIATFTYVVLRNGESVSTFGCSLSLCSGSSRVCVGTCNTGVSASARQAGASHAAGAERGEDLGFSACWLEC
jgi:hypothetical protein